MPITFTHYKESANKNRSTKTTVDANPLARRIERLKKPQDKGLGDTIARIFAKFGGNKFKWVAKKLGLNCGCDDRQEYLNKRFPYDNGSDEKNR